MEFGTVIKNKMSDLAGKADKGVEKEVMETAVEDANLGTSQAEISQHCTVSTMEDREERNLVGIQPLNIKFKEMIEDEMTAASSSPVIPVSSREVRFGEVIVLPAKDAIIDTSEQAQVLSLADEAIPTIVESSEASEIEELEDQHSKDDAPNPSESKVIEAISKTEEMEKDPLLLEEMTNESKEATLSLDGFWEGMISEWKKRLAVMESLWEMKNKIRFNYSQCCHLIETYSNMEFLTQPPAEYLEIPSSGATEITRWLQSSLDTFMELTRIMQHGEVLVRDCTHEDWIRSALARMTVVPKKPEWKVVTSFSLHLQQFKWILHLIGLTVLNLVCISQNDPSANLKEEFQNYLQTFTIALPNSYTEMEESDRQIFLDRLAEYVETQSSVEVESSTDQQLAQFMQWRLHGRDPTKANISPQGFSRNMVFNEKLGSGGSGIVTKETWLGVEVAVKEMLDEGEFEKETEFACLQHPHIVPVLDYWHGNKYTLVMELMENDLWSHIRKLESKLSISRAIELMMQLAEPMKHLRECGVLHRDLKARNVMVSPCKCGDHECVTLKLADFGSSKYKPDASLNTTQNQGTRPWMAPEVWTGGLKEKYTMAADVYSFGITCSEILTGDEPFEGIRRTQLRKKVVDGLRPELPESCPAILSAYIHRCWATNPSERPQHFSEVCEFLQFCKEMLLRNGLPSKLSSANEDDARMLLTHLGLQWCLQKDANRLRISEDVYEHVVMLASRESKWLEVANLEDRSSIQLELANYLGNWTGAERHYETAIQVLRSLEDVRHPEAIWRLGYCFELGLGVTQDFVQAVLLYVSALELDPRFGNAYVELGRCYAIGRGVARSIERASEHWEKALTYQSKQFSIIKSIEEQLVILVARDEGETGRLKALTVCRERAAFRLLDMTATNSGRNLLAGALLDIIRQYRTELDSTDAEEPLQTDTSPEMLDLGEPLLDDQGENPTLYMGQDETKQKEHSVERSSEEKAVLEEILQFMCKEDRVVLKIIFQDLIPEEENAEDKERIKEDLHPMLDEFLTSSLSLLKHHHTFSPLSFFVASMLVWIMLSLFYPRSHISVFSVFPRLPLSAPWKAAFCAKFLDSQF